MASYSELHFAAKYLILFIYLFLFFGCNMQHSKPLGEDRKEGSQKLIAFLPFTQKIFKQPIPENLWHYPTFFADAPLKKNVIPPLTALLGHPVQWIWTGRPCFIKLHLGLELSCFGFWIQKDLYRLKNVNDLKEWSNCQTRACII